MSVNLDQCICDVYVEVDVTSDRLRRDGNSVERQRFCDEIRKRMTQNYQDDFLMDRLFAIRKNGKLPRIRR